MMYEIKNSAENQETLDINIYSDVSAWGDYDESETGSMSAGKFKKELDKHPNVKNINVYINSCGGSVSEGVAIYSQIKRHSAFVTAYIDGFACSIASVIPMAADKVVMSDTSMMMVHNPWTITYGNAKQLRKDADDLDKILKGSILPAYKNKAGDKLSDEKLTELLDNETYLTSEECLEYGLCDEILATDKKNDAKEQFEDFMNKSKSVIMDRFEKMYAKAFPKDSENHEDQPPKQDPPEEKTPAPKNPEPQEDKQEQESNENEEIKNLVLSYLK